MTITECPSRAMTRKRVEQRVGLLRREDGRRLVEDEDAGSAEDRLDDLDPLLLADRELPDARVGVDVQLERLRDLAHLAPPGLAAEPEARPVPAEEDVLGDRERLDQPEVLVHHADAGVERVARAAEGHALAVQADLTLVRPVQAGEHVHERRLAGAVLAEERVHLAARAPRSVTPSLATTPGNRFVMPSMRTAGGREAPAEPAPPVRTSLTRLAGRRDRRDLPDHTLREPLHRVEVGEHLERLALGEPRACPSGRRSAPGRR